MNRFVPIGSNLKGLAEFASEDKRVLRTLLVNLMRAFQPRIESIEKSHSVDITVPDLLALEGYDVLVRPFNDIDMGNSNFVVVHQKTSISPAARFKFKGSRNVIIIGEGVDLSSSVIQCNGRMGCVIISDRTKFKECKIITAQKNTMAVLGADITWGGGFIVVQETGNYVLVGDKCMFSWEIGITPSDGHPIYDRLTGERVNPPNPVIVYEKVWLGRGVRIGKGVTLGRGSVVGQMSLVTKNTQPYAVYAGIPARLIRENIEWRHSTKEVFLPEDDA